MLVLTRSEVLDVRAMVTVAEITTWIRGLAVEVPIDHVDVGLDRESVVNCDGLHTVAQTSLRASWGRWVMTSCIGSVPPRVTHSAAEPVETRRSRDSFVSDERRAVHESAGTSPASTIKPANLLPNSIPRRS